MRLDPEETKNSTLRLKRARGQLDAVIRMLEEGSDCEETIIQLAATSKAIDRAGYSLIATGMQKCIAISGAEGIDVERLEKLFLSLS